MHDIEGSYDRVAEAYAEHYGDELDRKPLDRALLSFYARLVSGPVLDVGCGPGHIGAFLGGEGAAVAGLDLAPGMIATARRRNPTVRFEVGDLRDLGARGLGGIVAFYALCNLPPEELPRAARSFAQALAPGGWLLVAFHARHAGASYVHVDALLGTSVALDFWFHPSEVVAGHLADAGLEVRARLERDPYPAVEYASRRAYLLARRPGPAR
jgi:SAM-dependent methyltransferase